MRHNPAFSRKAFRSNALFLSVFVLGTLSSLSPADAAQSRYVAPGPNGKLTYTPYTFDGDTILDFSYCGYRRNEEPIPNVPTVITLTPPTGTATPDGNMAYPKGPDSLSVIQQALDKVAAQEPYTNGLRGAVLLTKGTWYVNGELRIDSGVVLRGEGDGENGTVLIFRNPKGTGIQIGSGLKAQSDKETESEIEDDYVPAGRMELTVEDASNLHPGDYISILKTPNSRWIRDLDLEKRQGWEAHQYKIQHIREIKGINENTLRIDAPLPQSITEDHGGGSVSKVDLSAASAHCGLESLRVVSNYDDSPGKVGLKGGKVTCSRCKPEKEALQNPDLLVYFPGNNRQVHAGTCPRIESLDKDQMQAFRFKDLISGSEDEDYNLKHAVKVNAMNAWVRDVTTLHMSRSSFLLKNSLYITVRDCKSLKPVSRIRGGRRYSFSNSDSSMTLFYKCYAEEGRHDFVTGSRDSGPIAFVFGRTKYANAMSEPHMKWATGILFDNIIMKEGGGLQVYNSGGSHGWTGANTVFWNSDAPVVRVESPGDDTPEENFAMGNRGEPSSEFKGDGEIEHSDVPVMPRSLFMQQLIDRLGPARANTVMQ